MLEQVRIISPASGSSDSAHYAEVKVAVVRLFLCSSVVQINLPRTDVTGAVVGFLLQQLLSCRSPLRGATTSIEEKRNKQSTQQGEVHTLHVLWFPFLVVVGVFSPKKNWQSGRLRDSHPSELS